MKRIGWLAVVLTAILATSELVTGMKTMRQIKLTTIVVLLQSLTTRAAVALLAFGTAISPILAADGSGAPRHALGRK